MKTFSISIFLFALFNSLVFGQSKDLPRQIDQFGEINPESLTVSMYHFNDELQQNPTAKGYIIIYRDKTIPFGFPIRFGVKLQSYLTKNLELPVERFEIINGGLINERKTQLWISPRGDKPPTANSIKEEFEADKSFLFDRFNYPTPYDGAGCCSIDGYTEEAKRASFDKFAEQLKEQPTSKAYLIFYGQYCIDCSSDTELDSSGTITRILRKEKTYLHKHYGIDNLKIITINGGYRKWQAIELWIVPKGSEIPKPKPETFPKKSEVRNDKINLL